jgi:ferric-dicitrate binding protein FerR (iron transport regulator)
MGRPAERSQVNQAEQQTDVVPADRPSRSPERFTAQSAQRGLSRRTVLVGLGLTGLAVAGGGITWWVLTPHLGTTLYTYHGHSGSVDAVAWSPDGRRIALGSYDKTVQVWVAAV